MARRFKKTTADYLAIAVSPALIMTLVGCLVYFLIEVFYVGEFHARLNYVFTLFVFAAVLIARISIELGSERALVLGLPLGIAIFLVLTKFVQHPNPFSHLFNLSLISIIWWCAHRLTWDCTLIDEREDASGEGLMQRIGADRSESDVSNDSPSEAEGRNQPHSDNRRELGTSENELLATDDDQLPGKPAWWKRWLGHHGPHPPGMWVLYFSLAALPIFGLGQRLIPASDMNRRAYVFVLLTVYVASALALLVTTSFLGLRRYLRQRHIEMPTPIAITWIVTGGLLLMGVLLVAMLLPRPYAEYAVSQIPWQVRSPAELSPSRRGYGTDGVQKKEIKKSTADPADQSQHAVQDQESQEQATQAVTDDRHQADQTTPDQTTPDGGQDPQSSSKDGSAESETRENGSQADESQTTESQKIPKRDPAKDPADAQEKNNSEEPSDETQSADQNQPQSDSSPAHDSTSNSQPRPSDSKPPDEQPSEETQSTSDRSSPTSTRPSPPELLEHLSLLRDGVMTIMKLLFYVFIALVIGTVAWKHRQALIGALVDIVRQLRAFLARLLGGKSAAPEQTADQSNITNKAAAPTFSQFKDPFQTKHAIPPEQLVRYTFEAFEAWARDRGIARRADQTPHELVRLAVPPQTALSQEARRMVRLYNSLAYAGVKVPPKKAAQLQALWVLMRKTN
jgi:hypothetical protein